MSNPDEITIEMQSRPRDEDARSLPLDYTGPGFWYWDGDGYTWSDNK